MYTPKAIGTNSVTGATEMSSLDEVEAPLFKGQLLRVLAIEETKWASVQVAWAPGEAIAAGVVVGAKYIVQTDKLKIVTVSKGFAATLLNPTPGGTDVRA